MPPKQSEFLHKRRLRPFFKDRGPSLSHTFTQHALLCACGYLGATPKKLIKTIPTCEACAIEECRGRQALQPCTSTFHFVTLGPGLSFYLSLVVPSESLGSFYNRKRCGNEQLFKTLSSQEGPYLGISRLYNGVCLTVEMR